MLSYRGKAIEVWDQDRRMKTVCQGCMRSSEEHNGWRWGLSSLPDHAVNTAGAVTEVAAGRAAHLAAASL